MTSNGDKSRKNLWRIAGMGLLIAAALVAWNWQLLTIWWSTPVWRHSPLPAFDAGKAQALSAQRRAELERELFSELWMWNTQSRRYQEPDSLGKRRQRWLEMSAEGYELAHLTLQVLDPGDPPHNPLPTFRRLEDLAQQGDAGAMCLYGGIAFQLPNWEVDWTPQRQKAREWMEKGAQLGHPQCLIALGSRLKSGTDGYSQDLKRSVEMLFSAIQQGYLLGAGILWSHVEGYGLDNKMNRRLVYCWQFHDAKIGLYDPGISIEVFKDKSPPERRAELVGELDALHQWKPPIEECVRLTREFLGN